MSTSPVKPPAVAAAAAEPARIEFSTTPWQAPLLPVALVMTAGIVVDRHFSIPLVFSLLIAGACLAAWLISQRGKHVSLPLVYLAIAGAALAAGYHQWYRENYRADDIGNYATTEPRPVRLQGVLVEEPVINWQPPQSPLQSITRVDPTQATLRVHALRQRDDWVSVSGRARLLVAGHLQGFHIGDDVEVVGRLAAPHGPANPGEQDYASFLRDQRIRAQVAVQKTTDAVALLSQGWRRSVMGWLVVVRGWGQRVLEQALPREQSGVATALLLGEGSTMTNEAWEKYIKTGVIHVLAISGQHLVVLAAFLWLVLRVAGVRRRSGAIGVALFLLAYSLLTGGRPPVMRSAVMVCAACGAILLRRISLPANSFALGWLVVALLNPTDLFGAGCQLSFLAVAILYWGTGPWLARRTDPLDRLVEQSRPLWQQMARRLCRQVVMTYMITAVIWVAAAPLVASRYHLVSPIGILIGPPTVILTTIALLAGFLLLAMSLVWWPLTIPFALATRWSLAACELIVNRTQAWPGSYWYVGDVPEWWLWVFYGAMFGILTLQWLQRRWRWAGLAGVLWLCVGLGSDWVRPASHELRCTFLAVGHGGCLVMESSDGRVLLYDAGALGGPDVTRRQIAPFLWSRHIRRVDEVFLSHADLDHFNGIPALLERFAVGQVTCTPTFADKTIEGVQVTLAAIDRRHVPVRIVRAGDRLSAGDVTLDVLHPPPAGPAGSENARSMVLLVRHANNSILLTGDLEGLGLDRVLALPPFPIDVLMAPHHGSKTANIPALADWAKPRVVISCQGPPRSAARSPDPYASVGAQFLGTWPHGAVTVHSRQGGLVVETFQTGQRLNVGTR
jgi:competence protein ComEC